MNAKAPLALVINCGSSSLRFAMVDPVAGTRPVSGVVERIGAISAIVTVRHGDGERRRESVAVKDHAGAVDFVLGTALAGVDRSGVGAVGHRVVHGGERFSQSILIDDDVAHAIADAFDLAPLHNPANLAGITAARAALPDVPHVAVFDTAFHQTMPPVAFGYAIPERFYRKHRIRRYGFHGPSHFYVSRRLYALGGIGENGSRVITCHLGNGASMCAIRDGRSIDTSMGMTPLAGLVMGTRCGDIDPSVVFDLVEKEEMSLAEVHSLLNRHSGLLGVSGYASDVRDLIEEADRGDARCAQALEMFAYRARGYVGQYLALLGGCDAIAFTAGVGENSPRVRAAVCAGLEGLGIRLDPALNDAAVGVEARISTADSAVRVWVIPTDEERVIAGDALRVAARSAG